ncbi:MAG: sortase [Acidimicrobiia bacterium]
MHRSSRWAARATLIAVAVLFAACGSDSKDVAEDVPMLVAPATTSTAAPAPTSTTLASTTSAAPATTTTIALPVPAAVPGPGVVEPVIELATIEIPKIGIAKKMFEGVTLGTLDHGPGHWPGSALPGQIGNMVVAGHRMSHDRPFRDLDLLVPGDEMALSDATGRHVYRVVSTEIVQPDALWILDQTPAATATLFACHPKGSTKQRIVVHLELDPAA